MPRSPRPGHPGSRRGVGSTGNAGSGCDAPSPAHCMRRRACTVGTGTSSTGRAFPGRVHALSTECPFRWTKSYGNDVAPEGPNGPQEAPKDPARCATRPRPWSRSSITSPSRVDRTPRPTTVQQTGRPDGNWFSCDLVRPVVARCTAAGSPHRNQKSAGIRSTCPGWMRFGSPMMSRFASRIGPNPVPMYSGSDAAIPDNVSPDWTTCSR